MMRRSLPLLALSATAIAVAPEFRWQDAAGDLKVSAQDGLIETLPGQPTRLELQGGPATMESAAQGMNLVATSAKATLQADPRRAGRQRISTADARGSVRFTRRVDDARGRHISVLTGDRAVYRLRGAEGQLTMSGKVTLEDSATRDGRRLRATGTGGTATVAAERPGANGPLLAADMRGPVQLRLVQAPGQGAVKGTNIDARADRMVLDNRRVPATLTLVGNVTANGTGPDRAFGTFRTPGRLVFELNAAGQVVRTQVTTGSGGTP